MKEQEQLVSVQYGHDGSRLLRDADMYPSIMRAIGEGCQNAIDMEAPKIWVTANLKTLNVSVLDNGIGTNEDEFSNRALKQVGVTIKKKGKLGRHGIGLFAFLGKCHDFTVTSRRKGSRDGFREWKFVTDDIRKMAKVSVPMRPRPDLTDDPKKAGDGVTHVEWSTEVSVHRINENALINRMTLDMLNEHLIANYNKALQTTGTTIFIRFIDENGSEENRTVTYRPFTGMPIPQYCHKHPISGGQAVFDLFLARPSGGRRSGKVQVGEAGDQFRFSFADMAKSHSEWLDEEARKMLQSGLFEGEITDTASILHVNRASFNQNVNLVNFCNAINHWAKTVGEKLLVDAEEERTDDRFQRIGLETLSRVDQLLRESSNSDLCRLVKSFARGTIARGHTETPDDVVGTQESTSLSIDGGAGGSRGPSSGDGPGGSDEPKEPKDGHTPLTVVGPRGVRRKIVKHHSLGIQLEHTSMPGSPELWVFDEKNGIIQINRRHPLLL